MRTGDGNIYNYVFLSCLFLECFIDVAGVRPTDPLNIGATTMISGAGHRSEQEKRNAKKDESKIGEREIREALEKIFGRKIYTLANSNKTADVSYTTEITTVTENTGDEEDTEINEKESLTTDTTTEATVLTTVTEKKNDTTGHDTEKYRGYITEESTQMCDLQEYDDLKQMKHDYLRSNYEESSYRTLDIHAILSHLFNMTHDYDVNITSEVNKALLGIPTCPSIPTTTMTTTTTTPPPTTREVNVSGPVIAKCFVCGMDDGEIPRSAPCADAFALDFIPMPVDHKALEHLISFKKYCKYDDVNNYRYSKQDNRSVFGRWTGGCSVRWVDLSGVYTQRSCRNRRRPSFGKHAVSKRMAKLEMALRHVDDGCIVSPMATLVPFSRGVSLYARFHACVCTGTWCNAAPLRHPWIATIVIAAVVNFYSFS